MPNLDVSDILLDPDFCEPLCVIRRTQVVDGRGLANIDETEIIPPPIGVVNPHLPDPVVLADDAERAKSDIYVHAYDFTFIGPTPNTQPDIVKWQGSRYLVRQILNFSKYGRGFTVARCELQVLTGSADG